METVKSTATGHIIECPICHKKYYLTHRGVYKNQKEVKALKHDFEEVSK